MIPLNFKDYYKKFQELTDKGTINTKNQIASPLSAGSRGLAKLEKLYDLRLAHLTLFNKIEKTPQPKILCVLPKIIFTKSINLRR